MSQFFKSYDTNKTIENTIDFFKNDFERLLLMSGHNLTALQSAGFSSEPSSSSVANPREEKVVCGITAGATVNAAFATVEHCSHDSKIILLDLVIKGKSWVSVARALHVERGKLAGLRRKALLEFADGFIHWQEVYNCAPLVDLHEPKKKETNSELLTN